MIEPVNFSDIDEEKESKYYYIDDRGNKVTVDIDALTDLENGEEFLLYYARHGEVSMVKRLLNSRKTGQIEFNIDCKGKKKSNHGWTPLHLASYFGHHEVIKILLEHGAQVNVMNDTGDTPLHKAAYIGRLDIVLLLLAHDANVFCKNGKGKTARDLCQNQEILDALMAAEESDMRKKEDKFLRASRDGDLDLIKELLNDINPVNINCKDTSGNTALHWAAYRNHKEIVVYLLQNGIDSNIENNQGQTPASMAENVQTKQIINDVQPISFNVNVNSLAKSMVNRFEGPLIRRTKLLVRKCIWIVLERGVLTFYSNRADASTATKRKGYKFLECAVVQASPKDEITFTIYFHDNSRVTLTTIPSNKSLSLIQLDRQKWINALKEHIEHATKFYRSGLPLGTSADGDDFISGIFAIDEDAKNGENCSNDLPDLLSTPSLQPYINNAQAHLAILQKHIKAMMQLVEEDSPFLRAEYSTNQISSDSFHRFSQQKRDFHTEWKNFWPSLKFHLNIILKSGDHTSAALSECITILSKQDQLRQLLAKRDQERIRVLEQSLRVLAREHHHHSNSSMSPRLKGHVSDTDADEYFDALDDDEEDEDFDISVSNRHASARKGLTNGHLQEKSSDNNDASGSNSSTAFSTVFQSSKELFAKTPD